VDGEIDEVTGDTFLDRLTAEQRSDLFAAGTRRRYPAGSTVFHVGEPAHEVLVVLAGEVKALVGSLDGREVILDVLGAGALLGEIAALDGDVRSATVQALGPIEVLAVRIDTFAEFLIAHPPVLHQLAVLVAGRLRASDRRQLEFGTGDSLGRVCARLLDVATRYGSTGDDGLMRVESPLSQSDLASWSGLSREAVVKSMGALRKLGWIRNDGRSITILEPDRLAERGAS